MFFPPFPFGGLDVLSLWDPRMWGIETLSPHHYVAEDQGKHHLPNTSVSRLWPEGCTEHWAEITSLWLWASGLALDRSSRLEWPGG